MPLGPGPGLQFGVAAPRLLTAGEAFEDLVFVGSTTAGAGRGSEDRRLPRQHRRRRVITAVAAARLGVSQRDPQRPQRAGGARLRRERVRVHNLRRGREPHAMSAALSTASDRAFVTYNGVNAVLEPRLLDALKTITADHLHLALTPLDLAAWIRCVRRVRRAGVTVSWDFGWSQSLAQHADLPALMDALDLVFVNELEAPLYALRQRRSTKPIRRCARASARVIVKLGSVGSRWLRSARGRRGDAGPAGRRRSTRPAPATPSAPGFCRRGFVALLRPPVSPPATRSGPRRLARPAASTPFRVPRRSPPCSGRKPGSFPAVARALAHSAVETARSGASALPPGPRDARRAS